MVITCRSSFQPINRPPRLPSKSPPWCRQASPVISSGLSQRASRPRSRPPDRPRGRSAFSFVSNTSSAIVRRSRHPTVTSHHPRTAPFSLARECRALEFFCRGAPGKFRFLLFFLLDPFRNRRNLSPCSRPGSFAVDPCNTASRCCPNPATRGVSPAGREGLQRLNFGSPHFLRLRTSRLEPQGLRAASHGSAQAQNPGAPQNLAVAARRCPRGGRGATRPRLAQAHNRKEPKP